MSRILTSAVASDRDGFTPVRAVEARAAFGFRRWNPVRDWLEANGHIECDHEAREGEKAFHYRVGERWRSRPIRHHKVDDAASLRAWRAIRGLPDDDEPAVADDDPVKRHLNRWLREMTLDPDAIDRGMASVGGEPGSRRRAYAQLIVDLTNLGDAADRIGEYCAYGRFHTIVTRMPKWMRDAIRIGGEPLGEVDIRATQPLVQAILAARHHAAAPPPAPPAATPPPSETIPVRFYTDPCIPDDLSEFFRDYPTVDFYRWVAPKFGMPCDDDDQRAEVKRAWAWLVFDRPRWEIPAWRSRWEEYSRACPSVASWLADAKRGNYREAARECQRFESRLMIQGVCGRLMRDHPDLPILTVHDAVLAPDAGIDAVCDAIRSSWADVGVEAALKIRMSA